MSLTVFLLVILAAFLHAAWNVLVRHTDDRLLSLVTLQSLMAFLGLGLMVWSGLPGGAAWIYALASGVLHTGYNLFLVRAYRAADLSLVYPVARGSAPLMTLVGAMIILGDSPGRSGVLAVVILVAGLMLTGWPQKTRRNPDPHAMYYAFGTACFIAIYTLVDGQGARVSGNALGYAGLVFVLDGVFMLMSCHAIRGKTLVQDMLPHWRNGLGAALASGGAYAIVIWAMTKAPMASVAALRETSIVFVLFMSVRVLNETLTPQRVIGGVLIAAGAVLLRFA